jgi:polyisoprenoid-binding protein YceI
MARKWTAMCLCLVLTLAATAKPAPERVVVIVKETSKIEFHASSTFAKVVGVFRVWDATFTLKSDTIADAALELKIDADSVHTGSGFKDKEVKGKNFFNVAQYPEILFVSNGVLPDPDPKKFTMTGNLTLRGITHPVTADIAVTPEPAGVQKITGTFAFNRRDFGMTHNMPFNKVADIIRVDFELGLPADAVPAPAKP